MKKVIATVTIVLLLSMSLACHGGYAGASSAIVFNDIKDHWAESSISKMVDRGVINGYPDGTFRPDNRVNIDEFIKMMIMSLTEKYSDGELGWSMEYFLRLNYAMQASLIETMEYFDLNDIPQTSYWADPYLDQAQRMGFLKRGNGGFFKEKYDIPLTRENAVYLVANLIGWSEHHENYNFAELVFDYLSDIKGTTMDVHIAGLILKGIMRGYPDDTFRPKGYITRGEAVTIVDRMSDLSKRDPFMPDLSNKYHTSVSIGNGDTKYYVFPSTEFLDVLEAIEKVKDTPSTYLNQESLRFSYTSSKEAYETWSMEMLKGNFFSDNPEEFRLLIAENYNDYYYQIVDIIRMGSEDYIVIFDPVIKVLFEKDAEQFKKVWHDYAEETKKGNPASISLIVNDREVRLVGEKGNYVSATISMKKSN